MNLSAGRTTSGPLSSDLAGAGKPGSHHRAAPNDAPRADLVGYSRVGPCVCVAGTTAASPDGPPVGGDDIGAQTRETIRRIGAALVGVGAQLDQVVRTRLFVVDITRSEQVGVAHDEAFTHIRPAITMIQVDALIDPALLFEIEVDAVVL